MHTVHHTYCIVNSITIVCSINADTVIYQGHKNALHGAPPMSQSTFVLCLQHARLPSSRPTSPERVVAMSSLRQATQLAAAGNAAVGMNSGGAFNVGFATYTSGGGSRPVSPSKQAVGRCAAVGSCRHTQSMCAAAGRLPGWCCAHTTWSPHGFH